MGQVVLHYSHWQLATTKLVLQTEIAEQYKYRLRRVERFQLVIAAVAVRCIKPEIEIKHSYVNLCVVANPIDLLIIS